MVIGKRQRSMSRCGFVRTVSESGLMSQKFSTTDLFRFLSGTGTNCLVRSRVRPRRYYEI